MSRTRFRIAAAAAAALFATTAPAQTGSSAALGQFEHATPMVGHWLYRALPGGGSEAVFIDSAATVRLTVRCAPATRIVTLSRTANAPATSMFVWTSSEERSLPARGESNPVRVSADVAANDRLLDAIAFSRGRFALSVPGSVPLVVVPGPEAARAFEDCRVR